MVREPRTIDRRIRDRRPALQRRLAAALLPILIFLAAPVRPADAWTPTTERAILARSLGTMPRPLRRVLTRHRGELYRAAKGIPSKKGLPRPRTIVVECEKTVRMIREQQPFALTARQLGRVGVLVAATADPYLAAADGSEPAPAHRGFERFTERMLHLIPFVLTGETGFTRQDLLEGRIGLADYLGHGLELSAAYRDALERHLPAVAGGIDPWAAFDARSTPFGISSISVSRSASRVSAVWQWIWEQAGGASATRPRGEPSSSTAP